MPKNSTLSPNSVKEHDNLHELFMQGVLGSCWCACRKCWDPQRVAGLCRFDPNRSILNTYEPMIVTDEDRRRYSAPPPAGLAGYARV